MMGNMNDARLIGLRAVAAADAINLRRGWKDPMDMVVGDDGAGRRTTGNIR